MEFKRRMDDSSTFKLPVRKASTRATDGSTRGRTVQWFEQMITNHIEELKTVPLEVSDRIETVERILTEIAAERMEDEAGVDDDMSLPRHLIRQYRDLTKERSELMIEIEKVRSGTAAREYARTANEYLRRFKACKKDTAASGQVEESLVCMSQDQNHRRYRKRSDLDRIIRMAQRGEDIEEPQRHSISDELLVEFHGADPPVYLMHGDLCPECGVLMRKAIEGGSLQCQACGTVSAIQDATSTTVGYSDDVEYANFTYKRDNHFQEWLNTTMAKQSQHVPDEVLEKVMQVLHRERVPVDQVNAKRVREALKEFRLRKYYEHAMLIACKLTAREWSRRSRSGCAVAFDRCKNRSSASATSSCQSERTSCRTRTSCTSYASWRTCRSSNSASACSRVAISYTNKTSCGRASARRCSGSTSPAFEKPTSVLTRKDAISGNNWRHRFYFVCHWNNAFDYSKRLVRLHFYKISDYPGF